MVTTSDSAASAVTLDNVEDIYPLTPMQHLMLMHSLRSPGSSTLVNQFRYRLRGTLDEARFARAWELVVARHQALRTAFIWEEVPEPVQVVRREVALSLQFVDLRQEPDPKRSRRAEEILVADRAEGIDLRRAPLLRLLVLRLQDDEHQLILTRHHLILDLWSAEIVFKEVFDAYLAPECLTERPAGRFRDYLEWLNQQDGVRAEAYWKKYLQGIEEPSLLFGSCASRSHWTEAGQASIKRVISGEIAMKLMNLARKHGLTTGAILQGVVALVISALTDRRDVIFGLTVSARPPGVIDVEQVVGSFINNVPVRMRIEDDMDCRQWLERIQTNQSERLNFEHVSPTDLHRWSGIATEAALFDLLLLLQSPLIRTTTVGDLDIEAASGPMDSALPLTLAIESASEGFVVTAVHEPDIVSVDAADEIVQAVAAGISCAAQGLPGRLGEFRQRIARTTPNWSDRDGGTSQSQRSALVVAEDEIEDSSDAAKLLRIFRRSLGNPDAGLDDDFFALGGTSIQAAIAFSEIERQFDRTLPLSTLFSAGSVRNLMHALDLPPPPSSSLISIQGFGARPPILAVSGIGGNVVGLSELARALGRGQPLFGLQSKALDGDELPLDTIEAIAESYIEECAEIQRGPCVLLGICFGANVAIEMARQLSDRNRPPALVIVLDPSFEEDGDGTTIAIPKIPTKFGFVMERLRGLFDAYRAQSGEERRAWLREKRATLMRKIRHRDLLHGNHLELKQRQVRAANLVAAERYRPLPYEGPMHAIITSDRQVDSSVEPRMKWVELVQQTITPVCVPGNDTGDVLSNHAHALARQIQQQIDAIIEESSDLD